VKRTVVIGASPNPERYSYRAINELRAHGYPVIALGTKQGMVADLAIETGRPHIADVDTVTLYVGPSNQPLWYDYILSLSPKRILFNPGTENIQFMKMATDRGIAVEASCTLVLLSLGNY
jgi:predicted CoA-binding protein